MRLRLHGWLAASTLLLFSVLFVACGILDPEQDAADVITLVNFTEEPLAFQAVELETSGRVDPNPVLEVEANSDRIIQPGNSVELTPDKIMGYEAGDDFVLFLYRLGAGHATIEGSRIVTAAELKRSRFRVTINSLLPDA